MPDIFDEVQEDLRNERAKRLAARYGGVFAALAVVALLAVGGWQGWRHYQTRQAEASAAEFIAIHRTAERPGADFAAAAARFDGVAATAPVGYRTLARLRAAALKDEAGNRAGALADWAAIAADTEADALYRDLAVLMGVLHALDTAPPDELAGRIAPLMLDTNPWRASAREVGALVAIRRERPEEARRALQSLTADAAAPQGIKDRANRLLAQLPAPPATPAPGAAGG